MRYTGRSKEDKFGHSLGHGPHPVHKSYSVPSGPVTTGPASTYCQDKRNKTSPNPITKNRIFLFLENNLNIFSILNQYITKTYKRKKGVLKFNFPPGTKKTYLVAE